MKFSEDYFSRRDLFNCVTTRNPHGIWLSARSGVRIFVYEEAFRFGLIFQKHPEQSQNEQSVNRKFTPLCKL
jgi:hypothetical protein